MAKTQDADTEFTPGAWHLARITVVRWASMPGVGAKEQNILVLQIKLAVLYRSPPTPPTPTPESQIAEFVGREAVVYLVCTKDRKPATTLGRKFLGDAGIELAPDGDTGNPRANGDVWLRIQFGPPDPIHGFQSVVDWKPADAAGVALAATTALRTAMPPRTPAFGLAFSRPGRATRNGTPIDLRASPLAWEVLRVLALRYPDYYPVKDLAPAAWTAARRKLPDDTESAARNIIRQLRPILRDHGLRIPDSVAGRGWRLEEI